jgi:hypothetical protein
MITDALLNIYVSIASWFIGILPPEAHLPQWAWDSADYFGQIINAIDVYLPVEQMMDVAVIFLAFLLVFIAIRTFIILWALARGRDVLRNIYNEAHEEL